MFHYSIHNSLPPVPVPNHTLLFFKIHFNVLFPSTPTSTKWSLSFRLKLILACISFISYAYTLEPSKQPSLLQRLVWCIARHPVPSTMRSFVYIFCRMFIIEFQMQGSQYQTQQLIIRAWALPTSVTGIINRCQSSCINR